MRLLVVFLFDFLCDCHVQPSSWTSAYTLATQSVVFRSATLESPGSLLEMQNLNARQTHKHTHTHTHHGCTELWNKSPRWCLLCIFQFEKGWSTLFFQGQSHQQGYSLLLSREVTLPFSIHSVALLSYISTGHVLQTSLVVVNCLLLAHLLTRL